MRAVAALLLLLAGAPAAPSARETLAADAETRWIAFELTPGNQIRFAMTVDGRPAIAILDTGASRSVLRRGWADGAVRDDGRAAAVGGSVPVGWRRTAALSLGPLSRTGGGLLVADLPAIATGSETPVDVIVGRDLTAGYALDLDYPNHRFRLLPSGRLPFTGEMAPLAVSPGRQVYESELRLGDARLRPMVVDTGDGSGVTVTRAGWKAAGLGGVRTTSAVAFGIAGPAVSDLAVAPRVRIGRADLRDVEVRIERAGGFGEATGAAGRIGSGLLGRYRVLLDPGAGRMVLRPGPDADRPPVKSTSGLLVGVLPDRLRVHHVMRGSPAMAAGWKDGDEICAIDGAVVTPDYAGGPTTGWSIGTPGRVVRLRDCAGADRPITLARFY